jgi:putative ABC transport system permease protein
MIDSETIRTARQNLAASGWRTILTIGAIVIGITAIIAMMSLGEGLNTSISRQFQSLGTNTLVVLPGKGFLETAFARLQEDDADTIERIRGVEFATPIYITTQQLTYKGNKKTRLAVGIDASRTEQLAGIGLLDLDAGRSLDPQDRTGVILGPTLAANTFDTPIPVKATLSINDTSFRVIGINRKASNSFLGGFFDSALILNSDTLLELSPTLTPSRIFVKTQDNADPSELKRKIEEELERSHRQTDFQVMAPDQIAQTAGSVIGIVQLVLIGIAGISLLVGGVGVMNTMYMSVSERTAEVGIMKAIGATDTQIRDIFLTEAALVGIVGGIIGVVLGMLLAALISFIASASGFDLSATVTIPMALGATVFSLALCLVFGYLPAKVAAEQDPVDAIRKNG